MNCIDCNKDIWDGSIRCKSCAKKGQLNSNFKNRIYKCKICDKKISHKGKNCSSCHMKNYWKNHPEKRVIKHYCEDCGKKIYPYKNVKRCPKCSTKGKNNGMFGKIAKHGKRIKYKNILMRSSWEIVFAQFLDLSGIGYLYESKRFYFKDNSYSPDFYIPEWDLYIEIKGWWNNKAKKKFNLFKKYYSNIKIRVLMHEELQELGIL